MSLAAFTWTDRARPIVELGVGDTRTPVGQAVWDAARWDTPGDSWAGTEPTWHDITCDTQSYRCTYGRVRLTDRFMIGTATVTVDNHTGWADPNVVADSTTLTVRPGRPIRFGVIHATFGVRWLFRGFVDAMTPIYDPADPDTVELSCIDALGEVNRAKFTAPDPAPAGDTTTTRISRVLNLAGWPPGKRDLQPASTVLIAQDMNVQAADLISQAADSDGGSVFGDLDANIVYRSRDWQTYPPGTPVDGTIGNVDPGDVCPTRWERPFNRADIATRVIVGREGDDTSRVAVDDPEGQLLYGIEPFERTDLLTASDDTLHLLARRFANARNHTTAPRVRSVTLDARTADNALDLMSTVNVYAPSRYRCRLQYPRGVVFDGEYFATAVAHDVTPNGWTLELNLDNAAPFAVIGNRWDSAHWDTDLWSAPVADLLAEARELMEALT